MVESTISEYAVIFKRLQTEFDMVEQFEPIKVVEGMYHEEGDCFIDNDQNVYSHMASLVDYGNVYACRIEITEVLKNNPEAALEFKNKLLKELSKYEYYKNIDDNSEEFGIIRMRNKETKEIGILKDCDCETHYKLYSDIRGYMNGTKDLDEIKKEKTQKKTEERLEENKTTTPDDIIREVKKTIKGQDEAIEKIVTLIWIKQNLPLIDKTNMLVLGPSGVGKTAIFKKIKKILNVPLSIYSVTGTSQAGYKGHDIEEMLAQLYFDADGDLERAQNGIVVIDEFDKISNNRENGELGTTAIQNELLKLIEGCERTVPLDNRKTINMDTSNIIFVGCGAFSNLYERKKKNVKPIGFDNAPEHIESTDDIKIDTEVIVEKGGIIRELAGRLPVIIRLNDLNNNREVLKDILLNSDESGFKQIMDTLDDLGIKIENIDAIVDSLVEDAISKKIGARGLVSSLMTMFIKIFKEIGNNPNKYSKLIIGDNFINDPSDYKLVPKRTKKRVKKTETKN